MTQFLATNIQEIQILFVEAIIFQRRFKKPPMEISVDDGSQNLETRQIVRSANACPTRPTSKFWLSDPG